MMDDVWCKTRWVMVMVMMAWMAPSAFCQAPADDDAGVNTQAAPAGDEVERLIEPPSDRADDWPIRGIWNLPNYDVTPDVQVKRPLLGGAAEPAELTEAQREMLEGQWSAAKGEALRIVELLRPDMRAMVDQLKIDPKSAAGVLSVAAGQATSAPYMKLQFAVDEKAPRLVHVYLFARATGDEKQAGERSAWRRYAIESIERTFGRPPAGRLEMRSMSGGFYFDWKPRWRHEPLPTVYRTQFAVLNMGKDWMLAWTSRRTPAQIAAAKKRLDDFPLDYDWQYAAIRSVKAAEQLTPQIRNPRTRLSVRCLPITRAELGAQMTQVLHEDRAAITQWLAGGDGGAEGFGSSGGDVGDGVFRGEVAPAWRVIFHPPGDRLTRVVGWVNPQSGQLMHMAITRPPRE